MVIIGGYPLSAFGWTTQVHLLCEVAAPPGRPVAPDWTGFAMLDRSPARLRTLIDWSVPGVRGPADLPMVHPAMAIADALMARWENPSDQAWVAGPDDLDPDGVPPDALPLLERALRDLGADAAHIEELRATYAPALDPRSGQVPPIYCR